MVMDALSIHDAVAQAVPVFIGGLIGLAGGLLSQLLIHRLAAKREQQKIRREHLESLVKALYANKQWLEEKFQAMMFRDEKDYRPSPLNEAQMIQSLHFPEMSSVIDKVVQAQLPMMQFIEKQRKDRFIDESKWLRNSWMHKPYAQALDDYMKAVEVATVKCRAVLNSLS
jgi:hypothetical protein